jgi:hypothetical protein
MARLRNRFSAGFARRSPWHGARLGSAAPVTYSRVAFSTPDGRSALFIIGDAHYTYILDAPGFPVLPPTTAISFTPAVGGALLLTHHPYLVRRPLLGGVSAQPASYRPVSRHYIPTSPKHTYQPPTVRATNGTQYNVFLFIRFSGKVDYRPPLPFCHLFPRSDAGVSSMRNFYKKVYNQIHLSRLPGAFPPRGFLPLSPARFTSHRTRQLQPRIYDLTLRHSREHTLLRAATHTPAPRHPSA